MASVGRNYSVTGDEIFCKTRQQNGFIKHSNINSYQETYTNGHTIKTATRQHQVMTRNDLKKPQKNLVCK